MAVTDDEVAFISLGTIEKILWTIRIGVCWNV